jgi:hypothetical protein
MNPEKTCCENCCAEKEFLKAREEAEEAFQDSLRFIEDNDVPVFRFPLGKGSLGIAVWRPIWPCKNSEKKPPILLAFCLCSPKDVWSDTTAKKLLGARLLNFIVPIESETICLPKKSWVFDIPMSEVSKALTDQDLVELFLRIVEGHCLHAAFERNYTDIPKWAIRAVLHNSLSEIIDSE